MRRLLGLGFFALVGCQANPAGLHDASVHHDSQGGGGGGGNEMCSPPPAYPDCSLTCGDGHVGMCNKSFMLSTHCQINTTETEVCDRASTLQCSSLGYYGGTATCSDCFSFSDTACDACSPGLLACIDSQFQRAPGLSVSGTLIAQPTAASIELFDASGVATASVPVAATSLTPTATGWLISSLQGIQALSFDGTLGPVQPILGPGATIAPGPVAGHYLELWRQGALMPVRAIIHDATGAIVGTAFDTFMFDTGGQLAATSDGVHAFLGLNGKLALVADDGGVAISSSTFPGFAHTTLTHATSNWYVSSEINDWSAQRFDGNGAPVGLAIHIAGNASSFAGDGDALLVVRETATTTLHAAPVVVVHYTVDGTAAAMITVGADRIPATPAELDHLGADIVVSWSGPQGLNLARATAP